MDKIMRKTLLLLLLLVTTGAAAQNPETFTVATLNVDGLPQKLLVINLNPDGPGSAGSARIGKYLVKKGYDLVMMQEDFNYNEEMSVLLEDDYQMDEWSGNVDVAGHNIDFLHLQNHRFECDGLMGAWKNGITVTAKERVAWTDFFGKFSHALDEMVTKGFRRYEVTLASGTQIVVYNMHMDAEMDRDAIIGNALKDRQAREGEWKQLRDDILAKLDNRPVIVMGDLNSYYFRDRMKELFVDPINESGRATVVDSWVELENKGEYPEYQDDCRIPEAEVGAANSEALDKIICINPVEGTQLRPITYNQDRDGYMHDGKAMGDHYPVAVTFEVMGTADNIDEIAKNKSQTGEWYDLQGRRVDKPAKGIYLDRNGNNTKKIIIK